MQSLIWIRNTVKSRLRGSMIGRALLQLRPDPPVQLIRVVCATRRSEKHFWQDTALGKSLKPWLKHPSISAAIIYGNKRGLPTVYNPHIVEVHGDDVLVFVHDDVWIDDSEWIAKLRLAFDRFDVIGVAGNQRISPNQPAWLFSKLAEDGFVWDSAYLSGSIGHGEHAHGSVSTYGPVPASCELLDGVFLAARASALRVSGVTFDEKFEFHFYDMDFCRVARRAGLRLGTWPISLTHQSGGSFGNPAWHTAFQRYREKWRR